MEKKISKVLFLGVSISSFFIILGLILATMENNFVFDQGNYNLFKFLMELKEFKATAFLMLGIFLLILTPIIRVIGMLIQYIFVKDKNFIIISFLILLILFVSLMLGTTHS